MNKICEACDTKNRLKLCQGKDFEFKYCYRKAGSVDGIRETITPFNTLDELYERVIKDSWGWCNCHISRESLEMKDYGDNMNLLLGKFDNQEDKFPIGYVTK